MRFMLKQIENLITIKTIQIITDIIIERYLEFKKLIDSETCQNLFLEEYAPHNRQYGASWAISSGFPSGSMINNELYVDKLTYSRNFTRPLLYNDRIKIMILNNGTDFYAEYLKDYYKMNKPNNREKKRFCFIKNTVDHRILKQITICYPNEYGKIIAEEELISKEQIKKKIKDLQYSEENVTA